MRAYAASGLSPAILPTAFTAFATVRPFIGLGAVAERVALPLGDEIKGHRDANNLIAV